MVVRSSNPAHLVRVDGRFQAASNNDSTDVFRLSDIKSSITWTPHQSWREPSGFLRSISCEFSSNSRGWTWSNTIMK